MIKEKTVTTTATHRDWIAPTPHQLPEVRGEVITWLRDNGPDFYHAMTLSGRQQMRPAGPPAEAATQLARQERHRVASNLYWVSEQMTNLAQTAGRELAEQILYRHDLPSPSGFMTFESPLATYLNQEGCRVQIVAVSWSPWDNPTAPGWTDALWMTFWSHPAPFRQDLNVNDPKVRRAHRLAPVMPDNELGWHLGVPIDLTDLPSDTTATWGKTVLAAWLLMLQPDHAAPSTARTGPHARKRLKRAGLPTSDVKIIHVHPRHQATNTTPPAHTDRRAPTARWTVRAHWRTYYVGPGRTRVERRWIEEHDAGPEGAPSGIPRTPVHVLDH